MLTPFWTCLKSTTFAVHSVRTERCADGERFGRDFERSGNPGREPSCRMDRSCSFAKSVHCEHIDDVDQVEGQVNEMMKERDLQDADVKINGKTREWRRGARKDPALDCADYLKDELRDSCDVGIDGNLHRR